MPGPKATNRTRRAPAPNSPNRKTQAHLDRRIQGWMDAGGETAKDGSGNTIKMHKPGSENRH